MWEAFAQSLAAGLKLWQSKDARKYQDKLIKLEREMREEKSKPEDQISDAVIDNLKFELCILGRAFSAESGK